MKTRQTNMLDHDLLIKISVQLENLATDFKNLSTNQAVTNESLGKRIRSLEDYKIYLVGWATGAGAFSALIVNYLIKRIP